MEGVQSIVNKDTMRAVICTAYGSPEVLKIARVSKPIPKENEILVKVMATAVNSGDVRVRGLAVEGFLKIVMRFVLGFFKPRKPILGTVFSGVVEQVGAKATSFEIGDEVYGTTGFAFGAHAEYLVVSSKREVIKKPANASFEQAAAIPFGGMTALYFLQKANIATHSNPNILIYGATGSVGIAAVQIAQYHHASITAICSENGRSLLNDLGCENVIDYGREDFTQIREKFDVIFDAVGKTTKKQCVHLLKRGGRYLTVGGLDVAAERREQLEFLRSLCEQGKFKAIIDKVYLFDEIIDAHVYVDTGKKKGNVVIKL